MTSSNLRSLGLGLVCATALPGQQQFDALVNAALPATAHSSNAVVFGDLDGDGDLDVVCGRAPLQNLLLLNDGLGRFSDVTASPQTSE